MKRRLIITKIISMKRSVKNPKWLEVNRDSIKKIKRHTNFLKLQIISDNLLTSF